MDVFAPANNEEIILNFRGEKMAKVVGRLASKKPRAGDVISGVLVKRGFNYHIVSPEELQHYTDLSQGVVLQKQVRIIKDLFKSVSSVNLLLDLLCRVSVSSSCSVLTQCYYCLNIL